MKKRNQNNQDVKIKVYNFCYKNCILTDKKKNNLKAEKLKKKEEKENWKGGKERRKNWLKLVDVIFAPEMAFSLDQKRIIRKREKNNICQI